MILINHNNTTTSPKIKHKSNPQLKIYTINKKSTILTHPHTYLCIAA